MKRTKLGDKLFNAIVKSDVPAIRTLASGGLDLLQEFDWGHAMHRAMYVNDPTVVAALVQLGVPVDQRNEQGKTPFFEGLHRDRSNSLLALLECGADVNQVSQLEGRTALMMLTREIASTDEEQSTWALDLTKELLIRGASISIRDRYGYCAAEHAVFWGCSDAIIGMLTDQDSRGAFGNTKTIFELTRASRKGDLEEVKSLSDRLQDLNVRDIFGESPLFIACGSGHRAVAEFLLSRGASVDFRNSNNDRTALMIAAGNRRIDIINLLVAAGADVNAQCSDGGRASNYAGSAEVRKLLVGKAWEASTRKARG